MDNRYIFPSNPAISPVVSKILVTILKDNLVILCVINFVPLAPRGSIFEEMWKGRKIG